MKPFNFFKQFLLNNWENILLFSIWGLITLYLIYIYALFPNIIADSTQNNTEILVVNAQILATIFAITISFVILGLQYVSQDLTPRIMNYFIKSREFFIFFGLYSIAIITNLFVASFPKIIDPSKFLFVSYIILVFCIFFLIIYSKFVIRGIQPITIIQTIEKNIPDNFNGTLIHLGQIQEPFNEIDDPFIDLEQIIIRSIRNNDHASYSYCLERIFVLNFKYLEKIGKCNVDSGYREVWKNTISLQNYFLRLNNQILFEILNQNNEAFLNEYMNSLIQIMEYLFDLKCHHAIEPLDEHFQEIGRLIIDRKYFRSFPDYLNVIRRIIKIEFSNLPSGNSSIIYSDLNSVKKPRTEKENDLWYFGERIRDSFFSELSFFVDLTERIQPKEFNNIFWRINRTIDQLVTTAVKKTDNESFQKHLVFVLLSDYLTIHENALKCKAYSGFSLDVLLMDISNHPQDSNISPLKGHIVGFYRKIGEISIKYDDPSGISDIGRASRVLIHQYPDIASEIVDQLITCSKKIKKNKEINRIQVEEIKRELLSIKNQNTEKIEEIDIKIDKEVVNIEREISGSLLIHEKRQNKKGRTFRSHNNLGHKKIRE